MSNVNETLIGKYKDEQRIISDYYKARDWSGRIVVVDGLVNPLRIDNRQECSPTDNQRDLPACAGFSACTLIETLYWKQTGKVKQLNSEQCYAFAKILDGQLNVDGTYLEHSLNAILNLCRNDPDFQFTKDAKIGLLYNDRTGNTVEQVKFLIHKFGIMQAGLAITDDWYSCNASDYVLRRGGRQIGGHAVNLCYYDQDYVGILNQWGTQFGSKGYALMKWDDFLAEFMYGAYLYNIRY